MINKEIDLWILTTVFNKKGGISSYYCSLKFLNIRTDIKEYLEHRYDDIPPHLFSYKEVIYRIKNNIDKRPICPICGNPLPFYTQTHGYRLACSNRCILKLDIVQNKIRQTSLLKYGETNYNKTTESKLKHEKTCLEKYGVKSVLLSDIVKEKTRIHNLKLYGTEYYVQSDEFKSKQINTCLEKYGVEYASLSDIVKLKKEQYFLNKFNFLSYLNSEQYKKDMSIKYNVDSLNNIMELSNIKLKIYLTKLKHNSFNYSKDENYIYNRLLEKFSVDDIVRQYKSYVYPFKSDFYICSLDLYIEYQGTWCHNNHPFNNTLNDLNVILKWKNKHSEYYDYVIKVWTEIDPKKRQYAKDNKLNYLEFFNIDEFEKWFNFI